MKENLEKEMGMVKENQPKKILKAKNYDDGDREKLLEWENSKGWLSIQISPLTSTNPKENQHRTTKIYLTHSFLRDQTEFHIKMKNEERSNTNQSV